MPRLSIVGAGCPAFAPPSPRSPLLPECDPDFAPLEHGFALYRGALYLSVDAMLAARWSTHLPATHPATLSYGGVVAAYRRGLGYVRAAGELTGANSPDPSGSPESQATESDSREAPAGAPVPDFFTRGSTGLYGVRVEYVRVEAVMALERAHRVLLPDGAGRRVLFEQAMADHITPRTPRKKYARFRHHYGDVLDGLLHNPDIRRRLMK